MQCGSWGEPGEGPAGVGVAAAEMVAERVEAGEEEADWRKQTERSSETGSHYQVARFLALQH